MGQTLFEKIWDEHVVADLGGGANLLHVDRHYLHELCVSRGFPTLHERGLAVRNPDLTFAAPDHVISSAPGRTGGAFPWSIKIMDTMRIETAKAGIRLFDIDEDGQGILHVIGPDQPPVEALFWAVGDWKSASGGQVVRRPDEDGKQVYWLNAANPI